MSDKVYTAEEAEALIAQHPDAYEEGVRYAMKIAQGYGGPAGREDAWVEFVSGDKDFNSLAPCGA